jgi:DnaJ-class molecular chaperone
MIICPNCKGRGEIEGPKHLPLSKWTPKQCPTCNGTGMADDRFRSRSICPSCQGWGEDPEHRKGYTCWKCKGDGLCSDARAEF